MNTEREEYRQEGMSIKTWLMLLGSIIILFVVGFVLFVASRWNHFDTLASILGVVILVSITLAIPLSIAGGLYYLHTLAGNKKIQARRFAANQNNVFSAYLDVENGRFIQAINGPQPEQVPAHYSPTIHTQNDVKDFVKLLEYAQSTKVQEIAAPATLIESHVPTFRESLDKELIGPGQRKMLLCHALLTDEQGMCIGYEPYQDELENNSTVFLGGASKSGKTTYMAHLAAQGALMNALYYVIDPHLTHPDKSVAKKLEALSHAFILPPARTESEIWRVLNHAKGVAEARKDGRETPYGDRQIIFILDEALAVLGQAHHTDNKEIILMYRDLALFLRDLGTQYAKFGVSGIIASQYVTKDAFRLPAPAGNVDFRDGCQNQILMRLPPNQAQAMRLIEAKDLRGVRTLPQGHGYMGLYTGEVFRMASGNVSRQDIEYVASLAQPSPDKSKQFSVPAQYPTSTQWEQGSTPVLEREIIDVAPSGVRSVPLRSASGTAHTGPLTSTVKPLVERSVQGTASGTQGTSKSFKKRFTPEQEIQFLNLYKKHGSVKTAIAQMHVSYGDYQPYASWLTRQNGEM